MKRFIKAFRELLLKVAPRWRSRGRNPLYAGRGSELLYIKAHEHFKTYAIRKAAKAGIKPGEYDQESLNLDYWEWIECN